MDLLACYGFDRHLHACTLCGPGGESTRPRGRGRALTMESENKNIRGVQISPLDSLGKF